jgi:polar amino acid transport system substrate-binding protein
MKRKKSALLAAVGSLALMLAACGGGEAETSEASAESSASETATEATEGSEQASTGAALAPMVATVEMMDLLPQEFLDEGVLHAATTDGNAPWSFLDPETRVVSGVDAELVNEAAARLGLIVEWSDVQFTAALPGVSGGRFDLYVSAMADRWDRQEAVNFIDYSSEGSGIVVPTGNPNNITGFEDLCGLRINYLTGSMFPPLIEELNAGACQDNPITSSESADKQAIYLAVASGQADVTFDTYGVSNYQFNTAEEGVNLELELAPVLPFAPANQGIAFSHDEPELIQAMAGAMQQMVEDGTYQEILDRWSVGDLALDQITINTVLEAELMDFLE